MTRETHLTLKRHFLPSSNLMTLLELQESFRPREKEELQVMPGIVQQLEEELEPHPSITNSKPLKKSSNAVRSFGWHDRF